jgi:hypothetical protein
MVPFHRHFGRRWTLMFSHFVKGGRAGLYRCPICPKTKVWWF